MKQAEKSRQSRERILAAATEEFGKKNYESASLNTICAAADISKGLLYHHFSGKDELYLCTASAAYSVLSAHLSGDSYVFSDPQTDINHYFELRQNFFKENPRIAGVFFGTVLQPPAHLAAQIAALRAELDAANARFYKSALQNTALRAGVDIDDAMEYFRLMGETFNLYFSQKMESAYDINTLAAVHERKLSKLLSIMLYGIVREKK